MLDKLKKWTPPESWTKITTFDIHTGGEPLRIITGGLPELPGDTILDRRRWMRDNLDHIRTALMWEPRGHREMYGCVITPPVTSEADFGVLFLHNEGYSTMCGHAVIGLAKLAVETEMVPVREPETVIRIDAPAGLVAAHVKVNKGKIGTVYFHNVPSFVAGLDETVHVPGLGNIQYDLAFGGAYYAFVQAKQVGLKCLKEEIFELIQKGMAIKKAVMKKRKIIHPYEKDLGFLYGTIFIAPPRNKGADSRNVCIFADGEVDRSPTGTGVSARMAIHYTRNEIGIGETMVIESIVDSRFTGSVIETTPFGDYEAVIPQVEGTAYISGRHEFFIDPDDPLKNGFILG
ncbi:proline racemase family protein [bacterium]